MHRATRHCLTHIADSSVVRLCLEPVTFEISRALEFALDHIEHALARRAVKQQRRARMATCVNVGYRAADLGSSPRAC